MTAYEDFLADPLRIQRYGNLLVELELEDSAGDPVLLYYSSGTPVDRQAFRTGPADTPANQLFERRVLDQQLSSRSSIWAAGKIGGKIEGDRADLRLNNADGALDQYAPFNGYRWNGRRVTVRWGSGSGVPSAPGYMAYDDFGIVFVGQLGEPVFDISQGTSGNFLRCPVYGLEKHFDQPLQQRVYRGTAGLIYFPASSFGAPGSKFAQLDITGDLTIEAWVNIRDGSGSRVICSWNVGAGVRYPFQLLRLSNGTVQFAYTHSTGTAANITTTATLTVSWWYHVAITIDGTAATWIIYNYQNDVETVETATLAAATRDAATGSFRVSSSGSALHGRLDDLRIWNVERTREEIRANRNQPFDDAEIPASLVGYWKFDDGTGLTAVDSSATGANLALSGSYAFYPSLTGAEDLAGRITTDCWGKCWDVSPILVDVATQTYQIGYGNRLQSLEVYEGANFLTLDTAHSDIYDLLNSTPAAGQYDTCLPEGFFRLGSQPTHPVTCVVEGYDVPAYFETASDIAKRIATARGRAPLSGSDIKTTTFDNLNTANSETVGLFVDRSMTCAEAMDIILESVGAWWGYTRGDEELQVHQFDGPAVTADWEFDNRTIVSISSAESLTRSGELVVLYRRSHTRLSEDQIAWVSANPKDVQRLRANRGEFDGWSRVNYQDRDVLDAYPDASVLVVETNFTSRRAAIVEGLRRFALFSQEHEMFWVVVQVPGSVTLGQTVSLNVSINGNIRLGLDGTRLFYVLAVEDGGQEGNIRILVWG